MAPPTAQVGPDGPTCVSPKNGTGKPFDGSSKRTSTIAPGRKPNPLKVACWPGVMRVLESETDGSGQTALEVGVAVKAPNGVGVAVGPDTWNCAVSCSGW